MTRRKIVVILAAVILVTILEVTRVYYGNPIIDEIADHGSDALNATFPCNEDNAQNC